MPLKTDRNSLPWGKYPHASLIRQSGTQTWSDSRSNQTWWPLHINKAAKRKKEKHHRTNMQTKVFQVVHHTNPNRIDPLMIGKQNLEQHGRDIPRQEDSLSQHPASSAVETFRSSTKELRLLLRGVNDSASWDATGSKERQPRSNPTQRPASESGEFLNREPRF